MSTLKKISISNTNRRRNPGSAPYFEDFKGLIEYLEDNGISKVSLTYCIINESPKWLEGCVNLRIEDLTMSNFDWLAENVYDGRFLHVESQSNKPYVMKHNMLHETLMPFKKKQIEKYHNDISKKKHLEYFKNSIENYKKYEADKANFPKSDYKVYRQAEKDERFHTARTFINIFEHVEYDRNKILKALLINAYGNIPPFEKHKKNPISWDDLLQGELTLCFEKDVPAPKEYKEYLSNNLPERHFVPYVLDAATNKVNDFRKGLKDETQIDAFIENGKTGLKIYIKAKYLSDISCGVSYDVTRNQIVRNVDVMLEDTKGSSLFLLLTPKYFKDRPTTRLYGYKMNDYMKNHLTLMDDLCHRDSIKRTDWKQVSERLAWITWEDINSLL